MREYASFARAYTCGGSSARACTVRSCMHACMHAFTCLQAHKHASHIQPNTSTVREIMRSMCTRALLGRACACHLGVCACSVARMPPDTRVRCVRCLHVLLLGVGGGRHLANVPWGDLGAVQVDRFPRVHRDQDRTGISAPADPAVLTVSPRTAGADEGRANGSLTCRSGRGGIAAADCGECWARPSTLRSQWHAPPQTDRDSAKTGGSRAYCSCVRFSAASTWARFRFANFVPGASVTVLPVPSTRTCAHVNATTA